VKLGEYLREAAAKPWEWGVHDCCRFVAEWVVLCGRPDPMAIVWSDPERSYDSEFGALRTIAAGDGLEALWTEGMSYVGVAMLDRGAAPVAGDVGIVVRATECGTDEAAGIYSGERWVTLGLRGIVSSPAEIVKAWRP
jgi:hypothetical protein